MYSIVFFAHNWFWITLPLFLVCYVAIAAHLLHLTTSDCGYSGAGSIIAFWTVAPGLFRKYKRKLNDN
jgi:hypothetical protein